MAIRLVTHTPSATTTNHEGANAYLVSNEEFIIRFLMTGMTGNTFYVDEQNLAKDAKDILLKMAQDDPYFLAQAIVHAREQGTMRSAPIFALVILSMGDELRAKRLFQQIFPKVILTPGDLQDFYTLIRKAKIRGFSRTVRSAGAKWLAPLSEYHIIKYGSQQQDMSLKDIFRLTHPSPKQFPGMKLQEKAAYIVKGELAAPLDQIRGYEQFKTSAQRLKAGTHGITKQDVLSLVDEYKLPWEVVTSQIPSDTDVWRHMLYQMPYYALLRNLRNLVKYDVVKQSKELQYVVKTLTDPERVAKSKIFPFRFYAAYEALQAMNYASHTHALSDAVVQALEQSYRNVPDLGMVLVANDISSSMNQKATAKSDIEMRDIAAIGAAAIYKKASGGDIVSFTSEAIPRRVNRQDTIMTIAKQVMQGAGGTALWAPIAWAFNRDVYYDTAIFFTDSESWVDEVVYNNSPACYGYYQSHRPMTHSLQLIQQYKKKINPKLVCVFVQLAPYAHTPVPLNEPGCYFVSGWSDQVLSAIGHLRQGRAYLDIIRGTPLLSDVRVA